MEWISTAIPFFPPCYVVWTNMNGKLKNRIIIDIRTLNKITIPDVYPVIIQTEILFQIKDFKFISIINATSIFYQWWVNKTNRHRFTVVSYRGQEIFRISVMGYRNFPTYIQRIIDRIFRPHRDFSKVYVDDIVIFSSFLDEHVKHLNDVFFFIKKNNHFASQVFSWNTH